MHRVNVRSRSQEEGRGRKKIKRKSMRDPPPQTATRAARDSGSPIKNQFYLLAATMDVIRTGRCPQKKKRFLEGKLTGSPSGRWDW